MTLAANGTLSGTPTQTGTFPLVVKVTDANGCMGNGATYNLFIGCPAITLSPTNLPVAQTGAAFSQQLSANGATPHTFSFAASPTLPNWLTLSASGLLSGTPPTPGAYSFTVNVSDANGCPGTRSYTLTTNAAPTITAFNQTRQQGTSSATVQIAVVQDAEDNEFHLNVTVDGWVMATKNGVTVSNLAVNGAGQVTANVEANCTASTATFTLTVTDTTGATANANFTVTVTANPAPTVGNYANTAVTPGGSKTVTPSAAPTDDDGIDSITVSALPNFFNGILTANTATGAVTIANANPPGNYQIFVTVSDGCATTTRQFTLTVDPCVATLSKAGQNFSAQGGTGSFTVAIAGGCTWSAVSNNPDFITVTAPASAVAGTGTVSFTIASHANTAPRNGTITVAGQTFTVRQGAQFLDVPVGATFYEEIGKLSAVGVTQGCGGGNYCPDSNVSRDQMAAFLSRALGVFNPPTPGAQRFADVLPSNAFYAFIEEIAVRQITLGCGNGNYCPSDFVSRQQMAAFIIRALHEPGYLPPPPASQRFADVPSSNSFYAHIEELAVRGITLGCDGGNYCPPQNVTRTQMAAFLVRAFGL